MTNPYLSKIKRVVLQAGHGQGDPGSSYNGVLENTENNQIVARIARILKFCGLDVVVDPDLSLVNAIKYVNQNHKAGEDWCIEIHKDSTSDLSNLSSLKDKVGVYYYGGDANSQAIANQMISVIKNNGASNQSWSRPDTAGRFGRLGWIRDTIPLSHLIECGFIQDDTSNMADEKYAKWVAQAICDVLNVGFKYDLDQPQMPTTTPTVPVVNDVKLPWEFIAGFDSLPNAAYYQNSYRNNDWIRILSDIYDRDKEIAYWKQQTPISNQKLAQLKDLATKINLNTQELLSNISQ